MSKWIPITVKLPKAGVSELYIKQMLEKAVEPAKEDFEKTAATFSPKNKPEFKTKVTKTIKGYRVFTGVESNWSRGKKANKNDKYMFLTRGTSVRYATMSPDFRAKTTKGVIASGAGGGKRNPLYVSTANPQPGIEAREFEETIVKKRKRQIISDIRKGYIKGVLLRR